MKMNFAKSCLAVAAAGLISVSAVAEQKAVNLDQLLKMVKESKVLESKDSKQREADFRRQKSSQASLLKKAESTQLSEEKRSETLEATYAKQEIDVDAKRVQLNERMGSLKELFGHLTAAAGDLRTTLDGSLVSAQYPGRGEFLSELIEKMNSGTTLPSIKEIERVWYELQRETVESAKIVKFTGTVSLPGGEKVEQEVVRVGNFQLLSNGQYLNFVPKGAKMEVLARQPEEHNASASTLQDSTSGFTRVGIDPTGARGGSLLAALINTPNLVERWHQGQTVGYIISGVGVFGILLGLLRILVLTGVSSKVSRQLKSKKANTNNPLGRVLKVAEDNPGIDGETLELKLEEAVLKERPSIESGLSLLKIISAVAPLLGLLGTVTGMIQTFQAITIFGAGDPKAMAGGISGALVTTVLGLVVAIPTVLMHTFVNGKAKRVIHVLDEQAAGIIAENSERK